MRTFEEATCFDLYFQITENQEDEYLFTVIVEVKETAADIAGHWSKTPLQVRKSQFKPTKLEIGSINK